MEEGLREENKNHQEKEVILETDNFIYFSLNRGNPISGYDVDIAKVEDGLNTITDGEDFLLHVSAAFCGEGYALVAKKPYCELTLIGNKYYQHDKLLEDFKLEGSYREVRNGGLDLFDVEGNIVSDTYQRGFSFINIPIDNFFLIASKTDFIDEKPILKSFPVFLRGDGHFFFEIFTKNGKKEFRKSR